MEDITGLLQELQAPGTPLPRRINILETLRDAFSTLQATPGRFEATVPVLCQVPARSSRSLVCFLHRLRPETAPSRPHRCHPALTRLQCCPPALPTAAGGGARPAGGRRRRAREPAAQHCCGAVWPPAGATGSSGA
jgi:hypothetical protein